MQAFEVSFQLMTLGFQAMPEEQFSALLAKLKEDIGLREKLKAAADLDAAVELAKEAGFDVSKADWLRHQEGEAPIELNDEELERVAGGSGCWTFCVFSECVSKEDPK